MSPPDLAQSGKCTDQFCHASCVKPTSLIICLRVHLNPLYGSNRVELLSAAAIGIGFLGPVLNTEPLFNGEFMTDLSVLPPSTTITS